MFKLGLSLSVAVIATFAVVLAGILNEVRVGTILLRGLLGFLTTGALVYLFAYLIESKGLAGKEGVGDFQKKDEEEAMSALPPEDDETGGQEEESAEESGFQPLSEQNLEHVQSPAE